MKRLLVLTAAVTMMAPALANADIFSYSFGTTTMTNAPTSNTPTWQSINSAGSSGNLRAFYVTGDWNAVSGNPFSSEFRARLNPGATTVAAGSLTGAPATGTWIRSHGGVGNGNPFTFGHPQVTSWSNNVTTSPAAHGYNTNIHYSTGATMGGLFNLGLSQSFSGSSAQLTNGQVHFLTDCMAPVGFDTQNSLPGTTTGTMTQRPTGGNLATLTAAGTYHYAAMTFTAPATGVKHLAIHTGGPNFPTFDGYLLMYGPGGFNPLSPLANLIAHDDDSGSGLSNSADLFMSVTQGVQYTLVATTFSGTGPHYTGMFTVAGVPEPSAMLLVGAVVSILGYRRRRKA